MNHQTHRSLFALVLPLLLAAGSCSSSSKSTDGPATSTDAAAGTGGSGGGGGTGGTAGTDGAMSSTDAAPPPGPIAGPQDMHCAGMQPQMVSLDTAVCNFMPDGGMPDGGDTTPDYGVTMFNASGDDDDCKYHVTFTVTPVAENTDVYFTVTLVYKTDNTPVVPPTGISVMNMLTPEVYLDPTHPAPNTAWTVVSTGTTGQYKMGPIQFDASGMWTIRFHVREDCSDNPEDSPHGHAAFYIQVP